MAAFDTRNSTRRTGLVDEALEAARTAAALEAAREQGFREGLGQGFSQGHAAGHALAQQHNEQFARILGGLEGAVAALDETVAAEILALAVGLARQIVCTHIATNEEAILPVVREALHSVIAITQHPRLVMHPEDAEVVRRDMADELAAHHCRIAPDARMVKGGMRIEDGGFVLDASLPTRWKRTLATLGLGDDWLA